MWEFFLQDPSVKFKRTLGDRSFTAAVPKIWNVLTNYITKQRYENKKIQDRVKCMANRGVWQEISINAPSFPVVDG